MSAITPPRITFSTSFNASLAYLKPRNPVVLRGLLEAMKYLVEYGRSASLPDVGWGLAQSRYYNHTGEIRWPDPEIQSDYPTLAWRGLFIAAPECEWIHFTVLGNKLSHPGGANAWYDEHIALTDKIADSIQGNTSYPNI